MSWQGSVGATDYQVERASRRTGPWTAIAPHVDETDVQYRPLFVDTQVGPGKWFYRVRAWNQAGISTPSNVVGPVQVRQATLVDEMADFSLIQERRGALEIMTRDCRKAKEDAHRLAGKPGSAIVYRLSGPTRAVRLYAFFPGTVADFRFSISREGQNYHEIQMDKTVYLNNAGDYGYWKGALYHSQRLLGDDQFLRIEFSTEAQISRIEVDQQK